MTRRIRFSLDRTVVPSVSDLSGEVKYGTLDGETVREDGGGGRYALRDVRLLPPCSPTKIACVGRNYREHATELGNEVPSEPIIFLKPPSSLIAHGDEIVYPPLSKRVDHEAELAVIIGRRASRIDADDADQYIFGYTCLNDITARDLQKRDGQWTRGKGFDTFCAVGPWVVRAADLDPRQLRVKCFLNGEKKQDAPVTDMIFPIPVILAYITEFMTLEPGDIVATGTPSGVGPMQPGDVVRVDIEGLGILENSVVSR